MAKQIWTAGIDVGKANLDIAIHGLPKATLRVKRDAAGLQGNRVKEYVTNG